MKFRHLLAFPGGGVRGCVSALYVDRLVASNSLNLGRIHSFSGASTGSIVAAALAIGIDGNRIADLYQELAKDVFKPRFSPKWAARAVLSAPYSTDRLLGVLKNSFGERRLGEAKNLVIVSWNLAGKFIDRNAASPLLLHSHKTQLPFDLELQETMPLYLAVGASCAAPGYFEPVVFKSSKSGKAVYLADGGLVSNLSVLSNTLVCASDNYDKPVDLEHLTALVLGNGTRFFFQKGPTGGWKTPKMIDTLMGSITGANQILGHQTLTALLRDRFLNFDPAIPFVCAMDDVYKIKDLMAWAHTVDLSPVESWLRGYFV